jgi:hypothetical protein
VVVLSLLQHATVRAILPEAETPSVKDAASLKLFLPLHSRKRKNMTVAKSQKMSRKYRLITYALPPIVLAGGLILIGSPSASAADRTPNSSATAASGIANTNHVAKTTKAPGSTTTVSPFITLAGGGGDNVGSPPPPLGPVYDWICNVVWVYSWIILTGGIGYFGAAVSTVVCYLATHG